MKRRLAILATALLPCLALAEETNKESTPSASPKVILKTNKGDITIELDAKKAPITVKNFLSYVEKGHYNGTVFHRVIDGFMIQGGGFALEGKMPVQKTTGKGIKNESANGLKNDRGTIAMARTSDPNSATAQFFINVKDNDMLNHPNMGGYAVFGKVTAGMDVVDKIKSVPTGTAKLTMLHPRTGDKIQSSAPDVPKAPVTIITASVVK